MGFSNTVVICKYQSQNSSKGEEDEVKAEELRKACFLNKGITFRPDMKDGDMNPNERYFISSLIRYYEPEHILEIGVGDGFGSANILNTIQGTAATLTSIDINEYFNHPYRGEIRVGAYALKHYDTSKQWERCFRGDPAEVIESFNKKFDFVVLDTAHLHPVETLNFLSVFPFLSEDAIIVVHDIMVYLDRLHYAGVLEGFATRILTSVLCAEKYVPDFVGCGGYTNILAMRLSKDTKKYLYNLFDSLYIPWEMFPDSLSAVGRIIDKYYEYDLREIFWKAVEINIELSCTHKKDSIEYFGAIIQEESPIIYGAGEGFCKMRESWGDADFIQDLKIWDQNANLIDRIDGLNICCPNLEEMANGEQAVIITIENDEIYEEVREALSGLGYSVYRNMWTFLRDVIRKKRERKNE